MLDCNLDVLQARINISREEFLHALNEYDPKVAEQIIKEFLSIFLDETKDWAPKTREAANKVIEQNRNFEKLVTESTTKVDFASARMQQAVLHVTTEIIRLGTEIFNGPAPSGSTIEWLRARTDQFDRRQREFSAAGENATNTACQIGGRLHRIQRLATDLLLLQTQTLEAFKSKNLGLTFQDVIDHFLTEAKEWGIEKGIEESVKLVAERLQEVLPDIAQGQVPIVRTLIAAYKIARAMGPKEVKPDSTNELNKLVGLMEKENNLYQALDDAYTAAMDELNQLAKTPLQLASKSSN